MLWESPRQRSQSGRACDHVPQGASSSADMTQINVAAMRGAKSKGRTRPKDHGDGERAQSPGAHDVGFDRWDRQLIVSCASGYHWKLEGAGHLRLSVSHTPSERSRSESDVLRARPVPRRRVPASQLEDGVWASTSQGYAYDKATCGKLNQSSDVTEITRAKAAEKDKTCKPWLKFLRCQSTCVFMLYAYMWLIGCLAQRWSFATDQQMMLVHSLVWLPGLRVATFLEHEAVCCQSVNE